MEYLVAILAGGGFTFLIRLLETYFSRKDKNDETQEKLDLLIKNDESMQRGIERTQLMLLISDFPQRTEEIMEIAKSYFESHHGNYYLHSLFRTWLEDNNIEKPTWFN